MWPGRQGSSDPGRMVDSRWEVCGQWQARHDGGGGAGRQATVAGSSEAVAGRPALAWRGSIVVANDGRQASDRGELGWEAVVAGEGKTVMCD